MGLAQVYAEELGREHEERQREDHLAFRLALAHLGEVALTAAVSVGPSVGCRERPAEGQVDHGGCHCCSILE